MSDADSSSTRTRLFITAKALHLSERQMQMEFHELWEMLQRLSASVASVSGMVYEDCLGKFGGDEIAALIPLLEEAELGWFVRGIWGDSASRDKGTNVMDRSIYGFDLSLRSLHCLTRARIRTIRQLAARTEGQLLQLKNLGRRSLAEIRELLLNLGLELGSTTEVPEDEDTPAWWDVNLYFLLPIRTLTLVTPLLHDLESSAILCVGDLARCTSASLLRDYRIEVSRVGQIEHALLAVNLGLGEQIPDWQSSHFTELREFFQVELGESSRSLITGSKPPRESLLELVAGASSLEEELRQLATWVCSEPAARTGMRYLGWDGKGGATLEQTASEVGLTRERVRQIQSRIVDKLRPLDLRPALLTRAVEVLNRSLPCLAADVEQELRDRGISKEAFRVEGVLAASSVFGLQAPVIVRWFAKERLLTRRGQEHDLEKLIERALDLAVKQGIVRLSDLPFDGDKRVLRIVLEQKGALAWLDPNREWFWAPRSRANRILSRIRQILTVMPEIPLVTLRAALLWKEQIADSDLPIAVLRALLEQQPWCHCTSGLVMQTDDAARTAARAAAEFSMFQILEENGGALYIDDFIEQCEERGITPAAIGILRSTSALIQFEGDICRLPGTAMAPSAIRQRDATGVPRTVDSPQASDGVLTDLDAKSFTFVEDASIQLLARASGLGFGPAGRVWSLVELSLSAADFAQLRDWGHFGTVDFRKAQAKANGPLGLVLTAYCMEVARHEATEGEMWPQVYQSLGSLLRQLLFAAPGQPRQRIRDSIEYACRRYQLRHVFGSEGAQAWLRTVYLQFGITDVGWKRLPWWLSGQGFPIAVYDLLRQESPVYSESFAELWHTLQEFRWGTLKRTEARSALAANPWTFSVGVDLVLDLASSHREVERTTEPPVPENESLLAPPRLSWRGEEPCFEVTLARRLPDWMTAARYILVLGDLVRLQVGRNAEGDYEIDGGSVVLAPEQPAVPLDLLNNGLSVLPEPLALEFYTAEEEIAVFDLATGRKLSVWEPISQDRPAALLCAPDIALSPPAIESRFMFAGRRLLSIYRSGIPVGLMATLDGEPLWSPVEPLPQKASVGIEFVARCGGGVWGETAPVEIQVDPDMQVRKLRVGQQVLRALTSESGIVRFESAKLTPDLDLEKHAVLETLREGQLRRIPVRFQIVPSYGAAIESGGKWQVLRETGSLDKTELVGRRLIIRPPAFFNDHTIAAEDWALLEGTNFCDRPRGVNREFHAHLHGFGQSLELGLGPYNQTGDHRITVADAITNFGFIKAVRCSGDHWVIDFRTTIDPGLARISVWTCSGIVDLPSAVTDWRGLSCQVTHSLFSAPPVVFGIAFEGICVGTGLTESAPYSQLCSVIENGSDWDSIAGCLRWFRLPLLELHVRRSVTSRIMGHECRTLCIWTGTGDAPAPGLRQEDANRDPWQYVLRRFFERWRPSTDEAGIIVRHFDLLTGDPIQDFEQCWERYDELLNLHPVLLAGVANLGVAAVYPTATQYERRIFLDMLRNVSLDLSRNAKDAEQRHAEQKCRDEAAASMGVDLAFIEKSLLADAQALYSGAPVNTRNLRIALAVRPFRQWLAARLI